MQDSASIAGEKHTEEKAGCTEQRRRLDGLTHLGTKRQFSCWLCTNRFWSACGCIALDSATVSPFVRLKIIYKITLRRAGLSALKPMNCDFQFANRAFHQRAKFYSASLDI